MPISDLSLFVSWTEPYISWMYIYVYDLNGRNAYKKSSKQEGLEATSFNVQPEIRTLGQPFASV